MFRLPMLVMSVIMLLPSHNGGGGVFAFSSGGDSDDSNSVVCDTRLESYGDEEQLEASGKIMWWVKPATQTDDYTLRTADGDNPSDDPTVYVPGEWMEIHIRTKVEYMQYTGLLLYAVDSAETKVGDWGIQDSSKFWLPQNPGCDGKAVLHSNAAKAPYHQQFRFRPPVNITGPITFRCLIKYGLAFPSKEGSFYWPNKNGDLTLAKSSASQASGWYTGEPGESCYQTCQQVGLGCQSAQLQSGHAEIIDSLSPELPVFEPLMADCQPSSPRTSKESGLIHFHRSNCSEGASACAAEASMDYRRFCPCSTGGEFSATGRITPALSTLPLVFLSLLLSLFHSGSGRSKAVSVWSSLIIPLLFLFAFLLPTPVVAHNWINMPSRTGKLSMVSPCPKRRTGAPVHLQIGPDQLFPVEWAVGHNGYVYFVMVKGNNEHMLKLHTFGMFNDYLNNKPDSMADYMKEHKKYRVFSGKYSNIAGKPHYPVGTFEGDEITRPAIFPWRFGFNDAKYGIYAFDDDAKHQDNTKRAAYKSDKYPWIVAIHAFKITDKEPKDADIANIKFPAGTPSGRYVIHWMWGGYRDCIDVNVLEKDSTDLWGTPATPSYTFLRGDHCQFRTAVMRKDKFATNCQRVRRGENAAKCYKAVSNRANMAVNVIPWVQPKEYKFNSKPLLGVPNVNSPGDVLGWTCDSWRNREFNKFGTGGWTGWVSSDTPGTDGKDDERRSRFANILPCKEPTAIECRNKADQTAWDTSKEDANNYCDVEKGLLSYQSINFEVRWQCAEFDDLDAKVCYGFNLSPSTLEVGSHFDISHDPEDPVFYSTCYMRTNVRTFADDCPKCEELPFRATNVFGDRCVSCEVANQPANITFDAIWDLLEPDQCESCDFD